MTKITGAEYHHLTLFHHASDWVEGVKLRFPEYATALRDAPTYKVSSSAMYWKRMEWLWANFNQLIEFSASLDFRKWRVVRQRFAKKAIAALATRIVPKPSTSTYVGMGDWKTRSGVRGYPHVPVLAMRRALGQCATLLLVDEYKTSKVCSRCDHELSPYAARQVLRCKNSECRITWDRDVNASVKMFKLASDKVAGRDRQAVLCK